MNADPNEPGSLSQLNQYRHERISGAAYAFIACIVVTALSLALRDILVPANLVLIYLMAVVLVTMKYGRLAGIVSSFLSVLAFDVFFVLPYFLLTVDDTQYLLTFAIMLVVSLIISHLTANLNQQLALANYRERRAQALFSLSRDLSAALTLNEINEISERHFLSMFSSKAYVLYPGADEKIGHLKEDAQLTSLPQCYSLHVAQQLYDRQASNEGTGINIIAGMVYLPLKAPMRTRGVLVLVLTDATQTIDREHEQLLQTCASQIALAIERIHYVEVARRAMVAMESERLRSTLLSAISHDIRTPLTTIVGLSSALVSNQALSPDQVKELARSIQEDAERLNNFVTNLLDMAKLHSGPVKLNKQWQPLEEVIGTSLSLLSNALIEFKVDIELQVEVPLLEFDAVLIEHVLFNLLDNAIKYAAKGSWIRIAAVKAQNDVEISVQDDGPGVAPGLEQTIFDKFTRGEKETSLTGAGLGLSICQSIVEAHGGQIWVKNISGSGACFTFTLPIGSSPVANASELPEFIQTDLAL